MEVALNKIGMSCKFVYCLFYSWKQLIIYLAMSNKFIVPATWNRDGTFHHTMEGDDDMPGHVKSSLMGQSLNIPIRNGRLALGTWQGIYLNEHRDQGGWGGGHARQIIITLQGQAK